MRRTLRTIRFLNSSSARRRSSSTGLPVSHSDTFCSSLMRNLTGPARRSPGLNAVTASMQ